MSDEKRVNVVPDVEQVVGFLQTTPGTSSMTVSLSEWSEYLAAWWGYQDALARMNQQVVHANLRELTLEVEGYPIAYALVEEEPENG